MSIGWEMDAIYIYKDPFYAFRWIVLKFNERNARENIKAELFLKYLIMQATIHYDYEKVFSLINPEVILALIDVSDEFKANIDVYFRQLHAFNFYRNRNRR